MFYFYTPLKRQKTKSILKFSVRIEMEHWAELFWFSRRLIWKISDIFVCIFFQTLYVKYIEKLAGT